QAAAKVKEATAANGSVEGYENAEAAAKASVVVLSVPFPAQAGILKSIRESLRSAVLVDATVPLAATVGGKPTRLLGVWEGSAAEQARALVLPGTPVVAAFHNLAADILQDLSQPLEGDVLICGDDSAAKQRLFPLVQALTGLRPVDAGPLEMARIVESITALLISINRRYKVAHAGIRITGLPA
ncbi:MAG TPA: NADPH-dependent F420 reductase, partial [Terriglobia bacterium]|nr:NADPH-dependent F420 reductase [Terriglobia bacterium]